MSKSIVINDDLKEAMKQILYYIEEGYNHDDEYDRYMETIQKYYNELRRINDSINSGIFKNIDRIKEEVETYNNILKRFEIDRDSVLKNY